MNVITKWTNVMNEKKKKIPESQPRISRVLHEVIRIVDAGASARQVPSKILPFGKLAVITCIISKIYVNNSHALYELM